MMYRLNSKDLTEFQKQNSKIKAFVIGHNQKSHIRFDWATSKSPFVVIPSAEETVFDLLKGLNYLIVMRNKVLVVIWTEKELILEETDNEGNLVSYVSGGEGVLLEPYNGKGLMINPLSA